MIYPETFESKIGFDTIRREISRRCISALGVSSCETMQCSSDYDEISVWLSQTAEFLRISETESQFPLNHFLDVRQSLKQLRTPGSVISVESLFDLQRSLKTIAEITLFFSGEKRETYPHLAGLVSGMQSFGEITAECDRILDKLGNVKDSASPLLHDLRRTISSVTASISGILRRIISEGKQAGVLENDTMPSVRDGRLVIPVSPSHKRKVRGIVHDESATGKTMFIEPEEIVEANNRIRETEAEISREILRIMAEVSDVIRPHIDDLLGTYDTLGMIDFIRAKALFAKELGGEMPSVERNAVIEWYHATHPALQLSLTTQGKSVVPLNITLNQEDRILLISGPNAGGKSICLKTVGVVQYMMQCGMLPPVYSNSHMGIFKSIFIDIGDQQSLENDLSTYSSHLLSLKTLLSKSDNRSLVLIDEFGSGTEPQIGGAIAQAVLEQLNEKHVFGVITTHYHNLKQFAEETDGIVNGAMLYDRQKMKPLFQLSIGYPGSSFAIEIARKIGLPAKVVDKAASIVGSDYVNLDKYLLDIVRDRKYWENKRRDIHLKEKKLDNIISDYNSRVEKISTEHKSIIKEAKEQAKELIKQSNAEIERTIREIKETQAEKDVTKNARQQLEEFKRRLERRNATETPQNLRPIRQKNRGKNRELASASRTDNALAVGDNVRLKGGDSVGTIVETDGKTATVTFGNLKIQVETSSLERTMKQVSQAKFKSMIDHTDGSDSRSRQLNFKQEIDLRGMRADEALQAVTYFIDDALQFGIHRVRILHGTGNGILREVIRQQLHSTAGVAAYHDEDVRLGGAGITVVELD